MRRAAVAADTALILTTPVDTGRARGNWNVAVGHIDSGVRLLDFPDPSAAQSEAQAAIAPWRLGDGAIFIANSLPYIMPLENGSSAQAPNGMVQHAMLAARQQVNSGRLLE